MNELGSSTMKVEYVIGTYLKEQYCCNAYSINFAINLILSIYKRRETKDPVIALSENFMILEDSGKLSSRGKRNEKVRNKTTYTINIIVCTVSLDINV